MPRTAVASPARRHGCFLTTVVCMGQQARVTSVEAIQLFRGALIEFGDETRDAVEMLILEVRRAIDWLEHDRSHYWPEQTRRASDAVVTARNDLERCELAVRAEDRKSCLVEKKALEKAKERLKLCERKVELVKHWKRTLHHEVREFQGQMFKMTDFLDTDLPRALAALQRITTALDRYTQLDSRLDAATGVSRDAASQAETDQNRPADEGE